VAVVEKDPRFIPLLKDLAACADGRLKVVEDDALVVREAKILEAFPCGSTAHIVSNLPYNVGTPLLVKWLTGEFRPLSMTLMFQKEVAQRIVAPPGGADYGRLAILSQALCHARRVMDLPARAFTPPPHVASAVVHLAPLPWRPEDSLIGALRRVAQAAFGQRRKMLRSSLRALGGEELCRAAGVDPDTRAETVPVEGFMAMARALLAQTPDRASIGERV
jgi:16S rRNA (adenine1518-N6/adenine1519-N6)-dimethyltransferase